MITLPHLTPAIIDEFEIILTNGMTMPITIDTAAGDTFDTDSSPLIIRFMIAAKPSKTNTESMTTPEEISIFVSQVIAIIHRTREVMPPSPDQMETFKLLHKMNTTIQ